MTATNPFDALNAAIDAERQARPTFKTDDGRMFAFVRDGMDLRDISDPNRLDPYIKAHPVFDDRASFVAYTNRFRDDRSILLADFDCGEIRSHLDWHSCNQAKNDAKNTPQPRSHRATLKLRDSEEFKRWNAINEKMMDQTDFALFIEENVVDVIEPSHSELMEVCRDLEATQGVSFKSGVRLENGDRTFSYSTETHVKGDVRVPTEILLRIPLYEGEEPRDIVAKFRFRPSQQGLALGIKFHRVDFVRRAEFALMAHAAAEETGLPVMFGRA